MATHNPKESRATCESTLEYMYRGENHEHAVGKILHLGGNLFSPDPILQSLDGVVVNLDQIANELNAQAARHRGKGEDLFKHYVISLAPGEELEDYQWLELITSYMQALGYDNLTKWTAVGHKDTDCNHVHILACRVKNDRYGSLVSTFKDYEKGWPVMRRYENKFGLRQVESPDDSFGKNKSKGQLKFESKNGKNGSLDQAASIRSAFKRLYSDIGKPKNMRELVLGLSKCGVDVSVLTNDANEIGGISYKLKSINGKWISGSKVKATRFTWAALQKKEGISYDPRRDDPFLRNDDCNYEIYFNLEKVDRHSSMIFESNLRFQEQRFLLARFRRKQEIDLDAIMALVRFVLLILKMLFGVRLDQDDLEFISVPVNCESPDMNEARSIDDEIFQRVCRHYDLPIELLSELCFSLNPALMSTPKRSHEMSY